MPFAGVHGVRNSVLIEIRLQESGGMPPVGTDRASGVSRDQDQPCIGMPRRQLPRRLNAVHIQDQQPKAAAVAEGNGFRPLGGQHDALGASPTPQHADKARSHFLRSGTDAHTNCIVVYDTQPRLPPLASKHKPVLPATSAFERNSLHKCDIILYQISIKINCLSENSTQIPRQRSVCLRAAGRYAQDPSKQSGRPKSGKRLNDPDRHGIISLNRILRSFKRSRSVAVRADQYLPRRKLRSTHIQRERGKTE